ncbi:MAG: ABC transporter permease [Spirochaetales bacterium]|nr:ABC transporter permease [Spirochaetales bacterium]
MMNKTEKKNTPVVEARFSPASLLRKIIGSVSKAHKTYGLEWWIMIAGIVIVLFMLYMAFFPQTIAPFSALDQDTGPQLSAPDKTHIFGTDNLKRDVFSRVVFGSRTILGVAFSAALLSSIIGIPLGLFSGYFGGALDRILSLIMDSIYSFPGLILAIAFAAMLGPGVINITLAVSVIYIPTYFRLVRGQVLTLKEELYVEAAHSIGAPNIIILIKYIFPNVIATVVVVFSLNIADAIMTEAALSYIGLGLPAGIPDWGMDIAIGKSFLPSGVWWMITFPGLAIILLALGFTMLGEGLAEILNPRLLEK